MAAKIRRFLTVLPLVLYWPAIFIMAHIPIPGVVYRAHVSDKSLHFVAYMILMFLLWMAVGDCKKISWRKTSIWWAVAVIVVYAIADEVIQGFVGRNCDAMDFAADMAGATASLICFTSFTLWPAALVVTGCTIFLITNVAKANISQLLPVIEAVFHFLGYALITLVWLKNISAWRPIGDSKIKRSLIGLVAPAAFLAAVKTFSILTGREFGILAVVLAIAGIALAVGVSFSIEARTCRKDATQRVAGTA